MNKPNNAEKDNVENLPSHVAELCEKWRCVYRLKYGLESALRVGNVQVVDLRRDCCDLCRCLLRACETIHKLGKIEGIEVQWRKDAGMKILIYERARHGSAFDTRNVRLFRAENSVCPWGILPTPFSGMHPISKMICGDTVLFKAKTLLNECYYRHNSCGSGVAPFLPSRVVDVGKGDDDIKLVNSEKLKGRYVCLSHCWGLTQPLTTTTKNISDHLTRIPRKSLPKLFWNVLELVRHLEIQYIWIDSLCIIQDDHDDWVQESMRMCDIYENSFLTVCALTSHGCSDGLFDLSDNHVRQIDGTTQGGHAYSWLAIEGFPLDHANHVSEKMTFVARWPLLKRAWTLQEQVLPPRVLYFGDGELSWQCNFESFCECGQLSGWHMIPRAYNQFRRMIQSSDRRPKAHAWRELVSLYSALRMTRDSDKLPAISGLAHKLAQSIPAETYYAGLWSGSLLEDLMWFNSRGRYEPHEILSSDRGPSWSWAITNTRVGFSTGSCLNADFDNVFHGSYCVREDVKILNVRCELASADPMGELLGGSLEAEGRVYQATILNTASTSDDNQHSLVVEGWEHSPFSEYRPMHGRTLYLDDPRDPFGQKGLAVFQELKVICLPLARVRMVYAGISSSNTLIEQDFALILTLDPQRESGYKRLGMVGQATESVPLDADIAPYWEKRPSCFQEGGKRKVITIH